MEKKQIDVLAVMDRADAHYAGWDISAADKAVLDDLNEARDAVAELIEAGQYVADYVLSYSAQTYSPTACKEAHARLCDALDRVRSS